MTSPDDMWRDEWSAAAWPSGWRVHHVEQTGSTNADLLAASAAGVAGDRTVLVADHQTAGRGRLDRRWEAPPGANLLVSLLFDPIPPQPALAIQRVAVAACLAVESLVPDVRVGVKWPNDLVVDDRKLGGILAQQERQVAVVGLGLNVGWSPDEAADLGRRVSTAALLARLLAEFDVVGADASALHRGRLVTLGRRVRAGLPDGTDVVGVAEDVDPDGRLVVLDDAGRRRVLDVGDVVHLRGE